MRRFFLVALLMLLGGVGLVALIEREPGYVLLAYGNHTLETSVWIGLMLLVLFYLALHLLMRLVHRLFATRDLFSAWMSRRAYSRMLARCQMQLDAGQFQRVIDALGESGSGLEGQELRLMARARVGLGQWQEVLRLLPRLRRNKVFGDKELSGFEERAYLGLLADSGAGEIKSTWSGFPAEQRKNPRLLEDYGRRLLEQGDDLEAEKVLTKAIKREWNGRLVAQYGRIQGRDPMRRLKQAERWQKQHPEDPSLMLCLGRLSLLNNLWGQARDYFEASHRMQPSAEACAELARLLFSLGERERSAQYYREGLLLRESNLPEMPQPKKDGLRQTASA
jgi:HemY protein